MTDSDIVTACEHTSHGIFNFSSKPTGAWANYSEPTKTCSKCGVVKDLAKFYKDSSRNDGLHACCKLCAAAATAAYRVATKAKNLSSPLTQSELECLTKRCTRCGATKPLGSFGKSASMTDGMQIYCKACKSAEAASNYAKNQDKARAAAVAYRIAHPDKWKATAKKYQEANKDKIAAYYVANRERIAARQALYRACNPEVRRVENHTRRAREAQSGGKLSRGITAKLFKLQQGKCACCGETLETLKNGSVDGKKVHLDHIMPLSKGGTNTDENMQLLTSTCNLEKNKKDPIDFMQSRGFLL